MSSTLMLVTAGLFDFLPECVLTEQRRGVIVAEKDDGSDWAFSTETSKAPEAEKSHPAFGSGPQAQDSGFGASFAFNPDQEKNWGQKAVQNDAYEPRIEEEMGEGKGWGVVSRFFRSLWKPTDRSA